MSDMDVSMTDFCPMCGAYWACECASADGGPIRVASVEDFRIDGGPDFSRDAFVRIAAGDWDYSPGLDSRDPAPMLDPRTIGTKVFLTH